MVDYGGARRLGESGRVYHLENVVAETTHDRQPNVVDMAGRAARKVAACVETAVNVPEPADWIGIEGYVLDAETFAQGVCRDPSLILVSVKAQPRGAVGRLLGKREPGTKPGNTPALDRRVIPVDHPGDQLLLHAAGEICRFFLQYQSIILMWSFPSSAEVVLVFSTVLPLVKMLNSP